MTKVEGEHILSNLADLRRLSKALQATRPQIDEARRLVLDSAKSSSAQEGTAGSKIQQKMAVAKVKAKSQAKAESKAKAKGKEMVAFKAQLQIRKLSSQVKFLKFSLQQLSSDKKARKIRG
jgi:hypothetical protein